MAYIYPKLLNGKSEAREAALLTQMRKHIRLRHVQPHYQKKRN